MTASIAAFGLVPLLFANGPGSEIQKPLAIVVIGGLVTSTDPYARSAADPVSSLRRRDRITSSRNTESVMDQSACKLTLVYPPDSEDCLVELMLAAEPPLTGFTTWKAEGHGHDFNRASVRERVRGRVMRGVLVLILPRARLTSLLDDIRTQSGD